MRTSCLDMTGLRPLWFDLITGVFIVVLSACEAAEKDEALQVGDAKIILPAPNGCYRIDGKNDKVDSVLRAAVGDGVRLIAAYGSEIALAEALSGRMSSTQGVSFQAIIGTRVERITVTSEKFKKVKAATLADSKAFIEGLSKSEMARAGSEAMAILQKRATEIKVGETISLGVYDETEESISYALLMKME